MSCDASTPCPPTAVLRRFSQLSDRLAIAAELALLEGAQDARADEERLNRMLEGLKQSQSEHWWPLAAAIDSVGESSLSLRQLTRRVGRKQLVRELANAEARHWMASTGRARHVHMERLLLSPAELLVLRETFRLLSVKGTGDPSVAQLYGTLRELGFEMRQMRAELRATAGSAPSKDDAHVNFSESLDLALKKGALAGTEWVRTAAPVLPLAVLSTALRRAGLMQLLDNPREQQRYFQHSLDERGTAGSLARRQARATRELDGVERGLPLTEQARTPVQSTRSPVAQLPSLERRSAERESAPVRAALGVRMAALSLTRLPDAPLDVSLEVSPRQLVRRAAERAHRLAIHEGVRSPSPAAHAGKSTGVSPCRVRPAAAGVHAVLRETGHTRSSHALRQRRRLVAGHPSGVGVATLAHRLPVLHSL